MKRRIESIFWFTIENGPTILTIGFAGYVIALAQTTALSTEVMLSWILAILGLLAISELVERLSKLRRLEEMSRKTLKVIESKFGERGSADDFFMSRLPSIRSHIEKALDIRLCGVVLQRTTRENLDVFAKQLKEGASIKIMVLDPNSSAARRLIKPGTNITMDTVQANSQITIQNLKWLAKLPESKGTVELRFIDEDLYFNVLAFDPDKEYGTIFVEFYPQRWALGSRPRIELNVRRDGTWFNYFKNQFDKLWEDCTPVPLDNVH